MIRVAAIVGTVMLACVPAASAQEIRFGVHGAAVTHTEINQSLKANGLGIGGVVGMRVGRFAFEARGLWADLEPDRTTLAMFNVGQMDGRVSVLVARSVALEVGAGRRWIEPAFAAPEVGMIRVGILSEYPLTRIAMVWARGAYLVAPQFSGGGTAGLAVELSFGAAIGIGRLRAMGEYEFQRFDREVQRRDVPLQMTIARFGAEVVF